MVFLKIAGTQDGAIARGEPGHRRFSEASGSQLGTSLLPCLVVVTEQREGGHAAGISWVLAVKPPTEERIIGAQTSLVLNL